MITTLTAHPSIDRTLRVTRLERGGLMRASSVLVECAGKGVNVARALAVNGHAARAVLPACDDDARAFAALLHATGADICTVSIRGRTRTAITLIEPDATITKINEPGPALHASECEALVAAAVSAARDSQWLVASGSLPPGAPPDMYAKLAAALPAAREQLVADTSGGALASLVGIPCAVVKPNLAELAEVAGRALHTVGEVIDAAQCLRGKGWGTVLVSLGRNGCVLIDDEATYGTVRVRAVCNSVGAGDALLAGFLSAGGRGAAALGEGLAWAGASIRSEGTVGPTVLEHDRRAVTLAERPPHGLPIGGSA
ncbi:1-phosphofructokinase family hexose kinase [Candidatus Poriferisodalis sp.]|uniref:1-phosphofructokinase family hexose kinase n=1 Tax=Candidatus Poriferisodalis sp. TaxID=3101277 RepID=UPI003B023ADA